MTQDAPLDQKLEADAWLSAANAATDRGVPHLDAKAIVRAYLSALSRRVPASGGADGLAALRDANIRRQAIWCPDEVPDLSFRGNELSGETGEACNVIKKLERERHGWRGSRDTVEHLAEELADVVICADLCAITAGIDLAAAVVAKFNATSEKVGIDVKLAAAPSIPEGKAEPGDSDEDRLHRLRKGTPFDLQRISASLLEKRDELADLSRQSGDHGMEIATLAGEIGGLIGMIYPDNLPAAIRALSTPVKP